LGKERKRKVKKMERGGHASVRYLLSRETLKMLMKGDINHPLLLGKRGNKKEKLNHWMSLKSHWEGDLIYNPRNFKEKHRQTKKKKNKKGKDATRAPPVSRVDEMQQGPETASQ